MERNLSNEMRELVGEGKKIYKKMLLNSSTLALLGDENMTEYLKMMMLLSKSCDLSVDIIEKWEKLMDKMDKVMDVYLEQAEKANQ